MSAAPEPVASEPFLFFEVGASKLAVPAASLEQIVPLTSPTVVPLAPPHIPGLMNLRGEALPLLDVGAFLELVATEEPAATVLVCRAGAYRVGLLCHRAQGIREVGASAQRPPELAEPPRLRSLAKAELDASAGRVVLLDVEALLEAARVDG